MKFTLNDGSLDERSKPSKARAAAYLSHIANGEKHDRRLIVSRSLFTVAGAAVLISTRATTLRRRNTFWISSSRSG
jgi:hypothetical protein